MKTVNHIDPPSRTSSSHSGQSPGRKDFALELAKLNDHQLEVGHGMLSPEVPVHPDVLQKSDAAPGKSVKSLVQPVSTRVPIDVVTLPNHQLTVRAEASKNEVSRGSEEIIPLAVSRPLEMKPNVHPDSSPVASAAASAKKGWPTKPVVEATGMLPIFPSVSEPHTIEQNLDLPPGLSTRQQLNVLVAPTGVTEDIEGSRIFGVHLLASTYLSELTAREEVGCNVDAALANSLRPDPGTPLTHQARTPETTSFRGRALVEQAPQGDAEVILRMIMVDEPAMDGCHATRATAMASSAAATLAWPESLLRLTKGSDGSAVVWLRDYRVGDEEATSLVNALIQGAQAQGARLARIVLNGREVWISQNTSEKE